MPLTCQIESCPGLAVTGLVVRPLPCNTTRLHNSRAPQSLVFCGNEVRELLEYSAYGADGVQQAKTYGVAARCLLMSKGMHAARQPLYEPTIDCVLYVDGHAIMRLDHSNTVNLVAGNQTEEGRADGRGRAARFQSIVCLAADGNGRVFLTEGDDIRVLEVRTGEVKTLLSSAPLYGNWVALTYCTTAGALVAATKTAVCRFPPLQANSRGFASTPRVIAGSWSEGGEADGVGTAARFESISSIVSAKNGTHYVADGPILRSVDALATVTQIMKHRVYKLCGLVFLPSGGLACFNMLSDVVIVSDESGGFAPGNDALAGRLPAARPRLRVPWLPLSCVVAAMLALRILRRLRRGGLLRRQ